MAIILFIWMVFVTVSGMFLEINFKCGANRTSFLSFPSDSRVIIIYVPHGIYRPNLINNHALHLFVVLRLLTEITLVFITKVQLQQPSLNLDPRARFPFFLFKNKIFENWFEIDLWDTMRNIALSIFSMSAYQTFQATANLNRRGWQYR